ncbi:MAG: hypothetical protein EOR30_33315 [Mesorhizobium sp.]|uniref:hypothetical protein n=1 Tax=Mesorhizobium sp. TaxID=1871066 RepID=UPI000FCA1F80|nr:hypothetical protein EOA49_29745 [Mesorhizobium sp. M1A.F.Ca.IN.020.04.1.1]RUW05103.1 hypothetical protein EOA53_26730 [Mesorhizobium sp. M1A.F.Ca.IN.020.03.1.1]RVD16326.1 hypothetical protein EN738_30295 [Mesorhizobium sp. M4B.F.Ca.ET.017.02.2.1]RWA57774.1 MAG: hypothetical protein EOQ27_32690 [Mesorhizobium sp.]TGQ04619.1 hypothetical protein EN858_31845 [Mesorhizobium sp. M4B.F.Ca.ET.215.01.1.1]TGQ23762.1 hypothetical protein EN863_065185 [Mesorhizobium sp. M00.F.Ca.ET.220.01.1.1]TGQ971
MPWDTSRPSRKEGKQMSDQCQNAFRGKAGIGKSTAARVRSLLLSALGRTILFIGCDPEARGQ